MKKQKFTFFKKSLWAATLTFLGVLAFNLQVHAQAPANDDCGGAVNLTVGTTCAPTSGTTIGATQTTAAPDPSCGPPPAFGGWSDDVWYSFTTNSTQTTVQISFASIGGSGDLLADVLSSDDGTCNTLTSIDCSDDVNGSLPEFSNLSVTPNTTYFVRVASFFGIGTDDFTICITADLCPAPFSVATNSVTMTGASVTWSGTGNFIVEYGPAGFTPGNGASAGAGGTIISAAVSPQTISGLTLGTTYTVCVRNNCTAGSNGFSSNSPVDTFTTLVVAPANDNCAGAVNLPVNATCTPVSGTTIGATQSAVTPAPTCGASTNGWDDDVWYVLTTGSTQTGINIDFTSVSGDDDLVAQIYSSGNGTCSGTFVAVACSDDQGPGSLPVFTNQAVLPNTTYFIRVYSYSFGSSVNSDFTICATLPMPATVPVNDECLAAINISNQAQISGSNSNSTQSIPAGACGSGTAANDVWYKLTAATSGNITVVQNIPSEENLLLEILSGNCTNPVEIDCIQEASFNGANSITFAAAAGTTYYIRTYGWAGTEVASFTIQATGTPLPVSMDKLSGILISGNLAQLSWNTLSEQNNTGFHIQRADNGKDFRNVGFVPSLAAGGNSNSMLAYHFTDKESVAAPVYYRLQQADKDGKMFYSNIIRLSVQQNGAIALVAVPNPVKHAVTINTYGSRGSNAFIYIMDVAGKQINKIPVTGAETLIDMSILSQGIYIVKYADDIQTKTIKVNKQ